MERPKFESFQWRQEYACNIEKLDDHRQKLVVIFNLMIERYNARTCKDNITEPFFKLAYCTESFFFDLEVLMRQLNYPRFSEKKARHSAVLKRIVLFKEDFAQKKATVCSDMITFMSNWLQRDVINFDKQVVAFLKENGVES